MYYTRFLLSIAALAGTSLSQKSDAQFCSSLESSFFSEVAEGPQTPAAVLSFIATNTQIPVLTTFDPEGHQSQLCAIAAALPPSLLPEFQTFEQELFSAGKTQGTGINQYVTDCLPEAKASSVLSYLDYIFTATGNICEETPTATPTPGSGVSNGTYPAGTGSVYPTATGSPTLIPTAAAVKPTGALAGAALVGGVLGAAAML
ncbi:hypothetical protein HD806DRAFT_127589 [Xylariaceae sp. AK1471]|nr:hypothetical protein HD806DRAFT_127589 [Xylariaceae sp. AK1471]